MKKDKYLFVSVIDYKGGELRYEFKSNLSDYFEDLDKDCWKGNFETIFDYLRNKLTNELADPSALPLRVFNAIGDNIQEMSYQDIIDELALEGFKFWQGEAYKSMKQYFVSYEKARELKEAGFTDQCLAYYDQDRRLKPIDHDFVNFRSLSEGLIPAPLIVQAEEWEKENHK